MEEKKKRGRLRQSTSPPPVPAPSTEKAPNQAVTPTKAPTTESPSRKRPRLSLKSIRENKSPAVQKLTPFFTTSSHPKEAAPAPSVKQKNVNDGDEQKMERKPCVAALHNLGNTCFLNSVLQVLRHTPSFRDCISVLAKEVGYTAKERQDLCHLEKEDSDDEQEDVPTWTLVKNLQEVFRKMKRVETRFESGETNFLAIRPYDLMDSIERLNPMFEGNLQHDAHELLRCLLAYIQDASVEVNKFRRSHAPDVTTNGDVELLSDDLKVSSNDKTLRTDLGSPLKSKLPPNAMRTKTCSQSTLEMKVGNVMTTPTKKSVPYSPVTPERRVSSAVASSPKTPQQFDLERQLSAMPATTADKVMTNDFLPHGAQTQVNGETHGESLIMAAQNGGDTSSEVIGMMARPSRKKMTRRGRGRSKLSLQQSHQNGPHDGVRGQNGASQPLDSKCPTEGNNTEKLLSESTAQTNLLPSGSSQRSRSSTGCLGKRGRGRLRARPRRGTSLDGALSAKRELNGESKCQKTKEACPLFAEGMPGPGFQPNPEFVDKLSSGNGSGDCQPLVNGGSIAVVNGERENGPGADQNSCTVSSSPAPILAPATVRQRARKTLGLRRRIPSQNKEGIEKFFTKQASAESSAQVKTTDEKFSGNFKPRDLEEEPFSEMEKLLLNIGDDQGVSNNEKLKSDAIHNVSLAKVHLEKIRCDVDQYLAPTKPPVKFVTPVDDVIENMFQGTMALRTRCLECENYTERREEYQDMAVAVRKERRDDDDEDDDEEEEKEPHAWILSALREVEQLRDENKYFCDKCCRLVEAERSMHYLSTPQILTLHLKRFAASSGFFGQVSKINDHVSTPLILPCIRNSCQDQCSDPQHRYKLFAMVTHTGISISSGHYIAYVHVDHVTCRDPSQAEESKVKVDKKPPEKVKLNAESESLPCTVKGEEVSDSPSRCIPAQETKPSQSLCMIGEDGYICYLCRKSFKTVYHIQAHFNLDHPQCVDRLNLDSKSREGKVHILEISMKFPFHVHTKSVECNLCHDQFRNWKDLCKHQEDLHQKPVVKSFKTKEICPFCGSLEQMNSHIFAKHKNTSLKAIETESPLYPVSIVDHKIKCDLCDDMFKGYISLFTHQETTHGRVLVESKKGILCDLCGKWFVAVAGLSRHVVQAHIMVKIENKPVAIKNCAENNITSEPVKEENKVQSTEDIVPVKSELMEYELSDPNNNADPNNNLDTQHTNLNLPQGAGGSSSSCNGHQEKLETEQDVTGGWLECDDDDVTLLTNEKFEHILSPSGSSAPYLLFYKCMTPT